MAQVIHRSIKTVLDDSAFPHLNRRVRHNGTVNQGKDIGKPVNLFFYFLKQPTIQIAQYRFDVRQHFQRIAESNQIPWVGSFVADLAKKPFQIINRV